MRLNGEQNNEELNRKERLKKEFDRIIVFFEDLSDNKKTVILPLIQNAAFMKITLEDLRELIQRDGVVDYYQNGANQSGLKQSAALQSYNALIKNYAAIIKSLCDYLPPQIQRDFPLQPKEKSAAEIKSERRKEAAKQKKFHEEMALVAEYQKYQRETDSCDLLSFAQWKDRRG